MSTSITLPATIEAAKTALGAVGRLLTAKQWERAAIVYAFTKNEGKGRPANAGNPAFTATAFAALGITGLTNRDTVADYREAWELAIADGKANEAKPGDTITLPNLPWPPGTTSRRGSHGTEAEARAYITRNPQVAVEAMKAVPAVAEAVTTAIVDDNELANTVARKSFAKSIGAKDSGRFATPNTTIPTYEREKELAKAITIVTEAIKDEQSGAWTPDGMSVAMLTVLFLNLRDRADRIAAAQPAVHGEIDAFLRESNAAKE